MLKVLNSSWQVQSRLSEGDAEGEEGEADVGEGGVDGGGGRGKGGAGGADVIEKKDMPDAGVGELLRAIDGEDVFGVLPAFLRTEVCLRAVRFAGSEVCVDRDACFFGYAGGYLFCLIVTSSRFFHKMHRYGDYGVYVREKRGDDELACHKLAEMARKTAEFSIFEILHE